MCRFLQRWYLHEFTFEQLIIKRKLTICKKKLYPHSVVFSSPQKSVKTAPMKIIIYIVYMKTRFKYVLL